MLYLNQIIVHLIRIILDVVFITLDYFHIFRFYCLKNHVWTFNQSPSAGNQQKKAAQLMTIAKVTFIRKENTELSLNKLNFRRLCCAMHAAKSEI